MWEELGKVDKILVLNGYLFLPLWFDPDIAAASTDSAILAWSPALGAAPPDNILWRYEGELFIRTVFLPAVAGAAAALFHSQPLKADCPLPDLNNLIPSKLRVIIQEILPHFVRRRVLWQRGNQESQSLWKWLARQVQGHRPQPQLVRHWQETASLWRARLQKLQEQGRGLEPLPSGCYTGSQVLNWIQRQARAGVCQALAEQYQAALAILEAWLALEPEELLALAALVHQDQVEIDGFGWQKLPASGEYLVFKRTGAYLLEDYFRRPYLFPDCRVAVPTNGPFKPMVLERYKHPLLRGYRPRQWICLPESYQPAVEFSPAAVIQALEAGINALYFGYNPRQRNGYHSLDRYGRGVSDLDFEDLRLPPEHPLLQNGDLEVKNCYW